MVVLSAGYAKLRGRCEDKPRELCWTRTLVILCFTSLGRGLSDMDPRDHR